MKLQRDWKVDTNDLPFAKYIKGQALISLVQKGLRYHHLSLTVDENGQQTKALVPSMFFFGPESVGIESGNASKESMLKASDSVRGVSPASTIAQAPRPKPREPNTVVTPAEEVIPQPVKRGRKPAQTLSAGATSRKASGPADPEAVNGHAHENNVSPSLRTHHNAEDANMTNGHHDDKMDVDNENAVEMNDVSMGEVAEEPMAPLVHTLTNGESVATQVGPAKIMNLSPNSAILALDMAQTITRASWGSWDFETLTAQGETFCGVWNLSGQDLQPDSVKPLLKSLFPSGEPATVTAAAWDPRGNVLALATYSDRAQVHLFDGQDLRLFESLPASRRPIIMLRWHSNALRLVGVAPFEEDIDAGDSDIRSSILVWNVFSAQGASAPSTLTLPSTVFDIDTFEGEDPDDRDIVVACDSAVYHCSNSDNLEITQKWNTDSASRQEVWTYVRAAYARSRGPSIIVASAESATLWLPRHDVLRENAHDGPITGLEVKSRQQLANGVESIEVATSSLDGFIKVWEYNSQSGRLSCIHQLQFHPQSPVMCLAISSDQSYLAAASYNAVRIWDAKKKCELIASWEGREPEWKGSSIRDEDLTSAGGKSSVNGESSTGIADHTLAWQIGGKRLAFGLGSQVAVINFQR